MLDPPIYGSPMVTQSNTQIYTDLEPFPGGMVHRLDQLKAEEVELLKQCAELEQLLRSDPLSFENEALEVQLQQIHADHAQLLEELKGTREFYGRRINDMTSQLEDRSRATCTAQGHADCLGDLLLFHEDNQGKSGDDGGCMGLYGVVVVVMVLYIYIIYIINWHILILVPI